MNPDIVPSSSSRRTHPQGHAHPELPAPRDPDVQLIELFRWKLAAEGLSARTLEVYLPAARLFARWLAAESAPPLDSLKKLHIRRYLVWMMETARTRAGKPYAKGYISNQYRALQQLFKFLADELDTDDPMKTMSPPKVGEKIIPVITPDQLVAMLTLVARGRDFESRRDHVIMRLFVVTGLRLDELGSMATTKIDMQDMLITVIGKGDKERIVPFDPETRMALTRYLSVRATQKHAWRPAMWLGVNNRPPLTNNGIRQIITRRAKMVGATIHPHMFRHTWAHLMQQAGMSEGELMQLAGWTSPAMPRHYGRHLAASRAINTARRLLPSIVPDVDGRRRSP